MPEELPFRGYQLAAWRVPPVVAVVLSALVFTVPHFASRGGQESAVERVLYLAVPFGMGILAGSFVLLTRSVWAAVGVHAGWHTALLVGAIAGFGNGPVFWVACGAVATTIGAGAMVVAHRRGLPAVWTGPTR